MKTLNVLLTETAAKKKPKKKSDSPESSGLKLLQHHDEAASYHRLKGAEHSQHALHHGKQKKQGHLGVIHTQIASHHDELRKLYKKLGDTTYSAVKKHTGI